MRIRHAILRYSYESRLVMNAGQKKKKAEEKKEKDLKGSKSSA